MWSWQRWIRGFPADPIRNSRTTICWCELSFYLSFPCLFQLNKEEKLVSLHSSLMMFKKRLSWFGRSSWVWKEEITEPLYHHWETMCLPLLPAGVFLNGAKEQIGLCFPLSLLSLFWLPPLDSHFLCGRLFPLPAGKSSSCWCLTRIKNVWWYNSRIGTGYSAFKRRAVWGWRESTVSRSLEYGETKREKCCMWYR